MPETSFLIRKENIDIVCFSLSRWDAQISSPAVCLAKEFALTHRVFFIEHPYSLKDILRGERRKIKAPQITDRASGVVVIKPPPVLPINFLPEGIFYNAFSKLNNAILAGTLRNVIRSYNIKKYIFINFFDPFFLQKIPSDIKPERYVYQCMDNMSQVNYTSRHGLRMENEIVQRADLVLCTSMELARLKSKYSSKVHLHPNAADFDLFNTAFTDNIPRPPDLDFPRKKIIGFTGSIEYRTDFGLLKKTALKHPDKILFLVGPVSGDEHIRAGLNTLPNVVFAGARKIEELPAYIKYFDCAIIPYKKNQLTASIYPLKINEYLAAGKPVVATRFSDDIENFSAYAYVASADEEFVNYINTAVNENDTYKQEVRIKIASGNTWKSRVDEFWQLLK